jgi:HK97 family phage portal protein
MALRWPWSKSEAAAPRNAVQDSGGGVIINTAQELEQFLQSGATTHSGAVVNANTAMNQGPVYACVRLLSGPPATLPLQIKRRIDARTREDASDSDLWTLLNRKPNRWQKPHQFKRMMMAHVLLRGNGICLKVESRGRIIELLPLDPDRTEIKQNDDLTLRFEYQTKNGGRQTFQQKEIFHLFGLTLNGYSGVTPITYARETIGLAMSQQSFGASAFKNGLRASGVLTSEQTLSNDARGNLKASLDEYRSGGESEGKFLILEEGLKPSEMKMSAQDAQWVDSRKLSRSDIAMFFGVPPSMIGDNSGSDSNWGTGLEQKSSGFVTFTLEDYLTMWEEGITIDLNSDPAIYARYNRDALVKGNIKDRWDAHVKQLQWGVFSPNEVRALNDMNPRVGGDIYYPPPNTAGGEKPEAEREPKPSPEDDDDAA